MKDRINAFATLGHMILVAILAFLAAGGWSGKAPSADQVATLKRIDDGLAKIQAATAPTAVPPVVAPLPVSAPVPLMVRPVTPAPEATAKDVSARDVKASIDALTQYVLKNTPKPPIVMAPTSLREVNAARAARGLAPPVPDPRLDAVSAANDVQEQLRGLGHFVEPSGAFGQCAAAGCYTAQQAVAIWTNSPEHAAIMFDPAYHFGGLALDRATGYATLTVRP